MVPQLEQCTVLLLQFQAVPCKLVGVAPLPPQKSVLENVAGIVYVYVH